MRDNNNKWTKLSDHLTRLRIEPANVSSRAISPTLSHTDFVTVVSLLYSHQVRWILQARLQNAFSVTQTTVSKSVQATQSINAS